MRRILFPKTRKKPTMKHDVYPSRWVEMHVIPVLWQLTTNAKPQVCIGLSLDRKGPPTNNTH